MEPITLSQNHPHYSELKQLTDNLLSFTDADSIYLSLGDSIQERKTIISLIVKKGSSQTLEELYKITEKLFHSYPQFACKVFEADWAEYSLRKGNLFFLRHCSKRELVYSNPESSVTINPTAADLKQLLKKAKGRYTKSSEEIDIISKELSLYISNGNHLQAVYILHQTIRKLLYTVQRGQGFY